MTSEPNWASVSPNAFEELCAELLRREGFLNVGVMSGPGGKDLGRDIYAEELVPLKTGESRLERILIQCKNRPGKRALGIQDTTWYVERAKALGYSRLLIITSSDLASTAKLYLENCNRSAQGIQVSYWNETKLADLLAKHKDVFAKYVIDPFRRLLAQQAKRRPFLRFPQIAVAGHLDAESLLGNIAVEDKSLSSVRNSRAISIGKMIHHSRPVLDRLGLFDFVDSIYLPGVLVIQASANYLREICSTIDFAVITVDAELGIDPLIVECINALKAYKVPFAMCLVIHPTSVFSEPVEEMGLEYADRNEFERLGITQEVNEMTRRVSEVMRRLGFSALPFYDVPDFARTVAIVPMFRQATKPCTGLGELLSLLLGLINAYLRWELFEP
jgi:hypothetical protein